MTKLIPIAATCLIVATPALSQNTTPAPAQNANPAKPKLICETEEDIGSRLGRKRVCHTAEQWQQIKAETRDAIEKYQQQATGTPVSG
jgi:hypothetical protein